MKKQNEAGFSLVELLVVVIIIAIVAAIAIPNLLASRRAANEASAISSLRTIHSAEATYQATLGSNVGYATAAQLGAAGLVDTILGAASASKSGYSFTVSVPASQVYCGTAVATTQGTTGVRSFGVSQPGVIYAATDGSIACSAAGVMSGTGFAPIQ
jgi:type IV pilus assembly protein PilA